MAPLLRVGDDLTDIDVQAYLDKLRGQGAAGQTIRNTHTALASLYRHNRRKGYGNPTAAIDLPAPGEARDTVAEPSHAAKLIAALPERDRVAWALPFYTGLRLGEIRALRVRNVKSDDNNVRVLKVEHGWDERTGEISPKSKVGIRAIPIPETLRAILLSHHEATRSSEDDLLTGRTASLPFTGSNLRKRARKAWAATCTCDHTADEHDDACTVAGCGCARFQALARVDLHEARHSYSSYLDRAGISEVRCDRYMGHSSGSMRNRYTHQLADQLAEDAKTLDAYLVGAASGKVVSLPTAVAR